MHVQYIYKHDIMRLFMHLVGTSSFITSQPFVLSEGLLKTSFSPKGGVRHAIMNISVFLHLLYSSHIATQSTVVLVCPIHVAMILHIEGVN